MLYEVITNLLRESRRDRVFLLSADPETATRHVLCVGADGKTLWDKEYPRNNFV